MTERYERPKIGGRGRRLDPEKFPLPEPVDWTRLLATPPNRDLALGEWLPDGRAGAIYAKPKEGKTSLVIHDALFESEYTWTYLDREQAEDDLRELATDFDVTATEIEAKLHYYLYPSLPPMDQHGGGEFLIRLTQANGSHGVIFDTAKRYVEGEEDDNDTWQAFWEFTGSRLKKAGIPWARIDHAGKDLTRGQRGASAKNDDVDVVWELSRTNDGSKLRNKYSRVSWLPAEIDYVRHEGPVRFVRATLGLPPRTTEVIVLLDLLELPMETTCRIAAKQLRDLGHSFKNDAIAAAVRHRKYLHKKAAEQKLEDLEFGDLELATEQALFVPGTHIRSEGSEQVGEHRGTNHESPGRRRGTPRGTRGNNFRSASGNSSPPIGGTVPAPPKEQEGGLATPASLRGEPPPLREHSGRRARRIPRR